MLKCGFFSAFRTEYKFFFAVKAEYNIFFDWNNNYSRSDAVNNAAGYSNTIFLNTITVLAYLRFFLEYSSIFRSLNKSHWEYLRRDF